MKSTLVRVAAFFAVLLAACSTAAGGSGASAGTLGSSASAPAAPSQVPAHVQTGDLFAVGGGSRTIPASQMARVLTWAETSPNDTTTWRSGMKLLMYTDPNRQIAGEPLWNADETTFAHDCNNNRVSRSYGASAREQFLMDPHSRSLWAIWRAYVQRRFDRGHFTAVFEDDASNLAQMNGTPCRLDSRDWVAASIAEIRALGYPVVYNGLEPPLHRNEMADAIALNAVAIGGMMEDCYADHPRPPDGDRWKIEENTEIAMAKAQKLFFCLGSDGGDAAANPDRRIYELASFLLTYDPHTSVIWERWSTPSQSHVMPESAFVPLQPVQKTVRSIDDLHIGNGLYARSYYRCYLNGKALGPCAAVVNPDRYASAPLPKSGFGHALQPSGSGIFDGGTVGVGAAPSSLGPMQAVILLK